MDNSQDDDGKNGRIWDGRIWERTKNVFARFTQNKCSHEQPIVNLWKICKLYPFWEPVFSPDPPFLPFFTR